MTALGRLGFALAVGAVLIVVWLTALAQPIDVKTIVTKAIVAENRRCHDYMTTHPDVAKGYSNISVDSYCACEANLLIGSAAPDDLVRMMVDGNFEAKFGQRRHDTGLYCLNLLMRPRAN
ncbi:MAG TPA: hypothetical protein VJR70_02670 [Stellaceae bacterium]|nr:hypothetical protein [Stellaceae bacterium]